jgi:hypothetical protein
MMMTGSSTDGLPVPYDALLTLGLSDDAIAEALEFRPLVVAAQAHKAELPVPVATALGRACFRDR